MMTYDIGDQPTVTATIRDVDGTLTSPTSISVEYLSPESTTAVDGGSAAEDSTGVWSWTFPDVLDAAGLWRVKFFAAGALVAAEEIAVTVRSTKFS